jgi:hypothetical protein
MGEVYAAGAFKLRNLKERPPPIFLANEKSEKTM